MDRSASCQQAVSKLSVEGARRLTRGWATTMVAPNEKTRPCALLIQGSKIVAGNVTKTVKVRPNWLFQRTNTMKHIPQKTTQMRAHGHTTNANPNPSHSVVRVLSLPMMLWGKQPYGQLPGAMLIASFTPTVVVNPLGSWPVWSYTLNPSPTNQHKCMRRIPSQRLLPHLTSLLVRSINSIEVWLKIEDASRRTEAWKDTDKHVRKAKIPKTLFLSEEGKNATKPEGSIRANTITAEWMTGVDKTVRRLRPCTSRLRGAHRRRSGEDTPDPCKEVRWPTDVWVGGDGDSSERRNSPESGMPLRSIRMLQGLHQSVCKNL